jgi:hypothetical protein
MSEERNEGSPFFRMPTGEWSDVSPELRSELGRLCGDVEDRAPAELAMRLSELANRLFEQLSPDERDVRQVISTLRTAHAVAWDFYDAVQATRVSVDEYMRALRQNIDSFEDDLSELQKARKAA